jgi:hypothetical protein
VDALAVLALLPAEAVVQPRAGVVAAPLRAEAGAESTRRAEAAAVPLRAGTVVVVVVAAPLRAEAGAELTRRAEAAPVPLRVETVVVAPLHAEAAVWAELTRRAEAAYAPRGQVTVRREACDCREASPC